MIKIFFSISILIVTLSFFPGCKTLSEKNAEISDGYKKICIDRGFKKDTPEFWNCFDMQELKRNQKINTFGMFKFSISR